MGGEENITKTRNKENTMRSRLDKLLHGRSFIFTSGHAGEKGNKQADLWSALWQ